MNERDARLALSCVVEPATARVAEAVAEFGATAVWQQLVERSSDSPLARRARGFDAAPVLARAAAAGMRFVVPGDPEWPVQVGDLAGCEPVNDLTGAPLGLWVRGGGDLAGLTGKSVAIVGSRACTAYGETVASEFAAELGEAGYATVSGGAFGVDAAAHRGGLSSRTPTIAVLAGGLDEAYPPAHRSLFERIAEQGVLVSELPPGQHPTRMRFLGRNRLIAALSQGTVLVEAAMRSGARNTVTWANCLGRVVMAVPGPVTSALSYTPHRLIREAEAVLVTRAVEVQELLGPLDGALRRPPAARRPTDDLSPDALRVFEAIPARGGLSAGEVSLRSGVPLAACLGLLDRLADQGFIVQDARWEWRLPPRRASPEQLPLG